MAWNPELYLAFANHRLRPALDLVERIPLAAPGSIVDLGCGPGNVTARLAARWPEAEITGIDNDRAMLARARADYPAIRWQEGDIGSWRPEAPVELIFSGAALQWVGGHEELLPRLMQALAPGGVLAVQMPRNFEAPSHRAIHDTIEEGPWRDKVARLELRDPVASPESYDRLLAPLTRSLDIWETTYLHRLRGDDPVFDWTRGTALRPILAALSEAERPGFETAHRARLRRAYPPEADGHTLFPFRRLFLVAQR